MSDLYNVRFDPFFALKRLFPYLLRLRKLNLYILRLTPFCPHTDTVAEFYSSEGLKLFSS